MKLSHGGLALEIVVPVFNEEAVLEKSITKLANYLRNEMSVTWQITIADNASTDETPVIAAGLAASMSNVAYRRLDVKGRGWALRDAWTSSAAEVLAYVDVDLSTDLAALPPLVAPLLSGHSDISIGTRLGQSSRVSRGPQREFISRSYNFLLKRTMQVRFSDAQCGFKAVRAEVAKKLLPHIEDNGWFFDTELLIIAERSGLRIHEIPVDWVDDPDSRVDIMQTAADDIRGLVRVAGSLVKGSIPVQAIYAELGRRPMVAQSRPSFFGQVIRFGIVGAISTVAFALLYVLFQEPLGPQPANFLALLLTAVGNTAANRRFTFGMNGPDRLFTQQFQGLVVFTLAWSITSSSLLVLHTSAPHASPTMELVTLTGANILATLMRFVMLRVWVFRVPGTDPARRVVASSAQAVRAS
ncbi:MULTISPECIES: bifunctional glycosyltransferase family 2/GtrA family protein [unclassified Arthrobacter]|jgi:glycosyltransferase involved in cell wall biosynthesis|uniref:bifunctional glycosyltransferase family 2/GtrA family protein n=1 Tax=unclassified Arthrobacter TaxID=235627 RepID=UPI0011A6E2DF|nr:MULTISPECIES: bifunctional glycosyltransferase family 2/GtrA family protein [unclassified Arthrobacter]TWD52886.1 GtrA-like protein [Arthrobacter sp. AG367]BCW76515.1 sugar translocase [Arthrobacter sp. NicSoilB11]